MFSLNESNRFVVCREAADMRKGPNMLCGEIRQCGLDPTNGDVYVFIGASRHILKLLVWENGGYAVYYKRLEAGRISPKVFHHGGGGFRPMDWDELVLFMMGISPSAPRRRRYQQGACGKDKIGLLYELERQLRQSGADAKQIEAERRQKALPILEALDKWMEMAQASVTPKSLMGKAIAYAYKMMPRLKRYCSDGRYRIDNNACERGNRTPVLGSKNYLFSANDKYAQDNAVFYSLIETCVDLGVDPLEWLTKVLALPLLDMDDDALDPLLPQYQAKSDQDRKVRE